MSDDARATAARTPNDSPPQASVPSRRPRSPLRRLWSVVAVPLMSIALAVLVGAVIIVVSSPLIAGELDFGRPFAAYGALLAGSVGSESAIVNTLVNATPLVLAGLAVGIAFKAGLFNIGAQGQFLVGAVAAAAVGGALSRTDPLLAIPAAVLAAAVAGALFGFVPGFLKAWTGAHEVVTTIMLNYVAIFLVAYLVTGPLRAPGATFARTRDVGNAALPVVLGNNGHIAIAFAAIAVVAAWWLLARSTLGFEIRTVGANPDAARYAGMRPRFLTVLTLSLCGLLAGLAGAGEVLGISHFIGAGYGSNVGFDAIAVALLGRAHPVGILLAGLLFGGMRAGSGLMQIQPGSEIPAEMVDVLQAVILFFLAADLLVRRLLRMRAEGTGVDELQTITRSYGEQAAR